MRLYLQTTYFLLHLQEHKELGMSKKKKTSSQSTRPKAKPRSSAKQQVSLAKEPMLFGKRNYMLMGIGFVVVLIGCLLMLGGGMPDPNVWDESLIYSFRRITLAPIVILIGLSIEIYAIFSRPE